jgi:hypothetical protein
VLDTKTERDLYTINGLNFNIDILRKFHYYKWDNEDLTLQWKIFQRPFIDVKETCTPYLDNFMINFGWNFRLEYMHQVVLIVGGVLSGLYLVFIGATVVSVADDEKEPAEFFGGATILVKLAMLGMFIACHVLARWRVNSIAPLLEN